MTTPLILCLDGSTDVCSTALVTSRAAGGPVAPWEVVSRRQHHDGRAHARVLLDLIDQMLREIGEQPGALSVVVVGTGPGTFTGVRLTVATARALALALSIPVAGVSTLAALAASVAAPDPEAALIVPVVDARRGQVFYGLYARAANADAELPWTRVGPFAVCDRDELSKRILHEKGPIIAGPGGGFSALLVAEDASLVPCLAAGITLAMHDVRAEFLVQGQERLVEPGALPEGDRLGAWLLGKGSAAVNADAFSGPGGEGGGVGTPESVKPIYVRPPDADIHITKMRDPWGTKAMDS